MNNYRSLAVCVLTSLVIPANAGNKIENVKPNVLFIAVDDLRPNLGCYGDPIAISPNIDKLASQGIVFTHAYCQEALCSPSRTSLLTGRRPDEIGVVDQGTHFRVKHPNVITLPQLFKLNGYHSISIGKIFHFKKGYQDSISWSEPEMYKTGIKKEQYALPEHRTDGKSVSTECADLDDNAYWDGQIADSTIQYLHKFKSGHIPFFLAVGFLKPHLPFCAPKKYWDLYSENFDLDAKLRQRPENAPDLAFHHWEELRGYTDVPREGPLSPELDKRLRHGYYACISYVDAQVGKVINELKRLGMDKNTIIVLWGDHGYHLGEQDLWHKHTNFELDARAPLILKDPDIKKKGEIHQIVEFVDIYPTIIDLCNLKPITSLSGHSMRPLLNNNKFADWTNLAFNEMFRPYKAINGKIKPTYMGYAVRNDNYRYVGWFKTGEDHPSVEELYFLGNSRMETKNLIGNQDVRSVEKELRQRVVDYEQKNYSKAYK